MLIDLLTLPASMQASDSPMRSQGTNAGTSASASAATGLSRRRRATVHAAAAQPITPAVIARTLPMSRSSVSPAKYRAPTATVPASGAVTSSRPLSKG